MSKRKYKRQIWAGFTDGRPHYGMIDTGWDGWGNGCIRTLLVFTSKADAKKNKFEDVRPIEIRELPPSGR